MQTLTSSARGEINLLCVISECEEVSRPVINIQSAGLCWAAFAGELQVKSQASLATQEIEILMPTLDRLIDHLRLELCSINCVCNFNTTPLHSLPSTRAQHRINYVCNFHSNAPKAGI